MNGNKIPLLSHLKAGLARALQLISEITSATADALTEMQETVDGKMDVSVYDPAGEGKQVAFQDQLTEIQETISTGKAYAYLMDSDGNVLTTSDGLALIVDWTYQRL